MKHENIIVEIFVSMISIIAAILIFISQTGFDYSNILLLKTVCITFFIIYLPTILNRYFNRISIIRWYSTKAFILLVSLIVLVVGGQISNIFNIDLSVHFALVGLVLIITAVKAYLTSIFQISIIHIIIFVILSVFFTTAYYLSYNNHPLIYQKIITGAWAHRDALWFSTIAGIFKTYNVSSNGLDGLVPLYYHVLSYYVAGSLSSLIGINTITFYHVAYPILIIPISLLAFIYCVKQTSKYFSVLLRFKISNPIDIKFWVIFFVLFALPLPYQLVGYLGGERYQYFSSHSYSFALFSSFILISIIFSFSDNFLERNNHFWLNSIIFSFITIILYLVVSLSKVSFVFVIGALYGYLFIRLKLFKQIFHQFTMGGFIMVAVFLYYFILNTETFLKNPFEVQSSNISIISYIPFILPTVVFIFLKLYSCKLLYKKNIIKMFPNNELIDIELLILLMVILFPLTYQYFKGIQMHLAYILIMAHINMFYSAIFKKDYNITLNVN